MKLQSFLCLFFLSVVCSSCLTKNDYNKLPDKPRNILPPSTGNVSELVLIISDKLWAGKVGGVIREAFQESIKAVPQQEALFDIYNIEANEFSAIFKTHKNILYLSALEEPSFERKDERWAKDQLYVNLSNKTEDALLNILKARIYTIRSWFLEKDRQRRLEKLIISAEKKTQKHLKKSFSLNATIPKGYQVATEEKNFIWLRRDSPKRNVISNIWVYSEAYYNADQFNLEQLIHLRDSIGKEYVEGVRPQSFMATERLYSPHYNLVTKTPYTIETRGLWTMVNDFLGGAYVANAFLDDKKERFFYVEGFIYCPAERKRSHIHELETVLYSLSSN